MKHKTSFSIILLTTMMCVANACAFIYIDDAKLIDDPDVGDYAILLVLSIPIGQGNFDIRIDDLGNGSFQLYSAGIAELYALYSANSGDAITPDFAQNNTPLVANYSPGPFSSIITLGLDESLFFGYWDNRTTFDSTPDVSDNYGWLELYNSAEGLSLLGSATAEGGGIYVGTYTQIPEPATTALLLLGVLPLACRRKMK